MHNEAADQSVAIDYVGYQGMNQRFLNSPEDCDWLRSTVLGGRTDLSFSSFILYGNEDSPDAVHLYADPEPTIWDEPHVIRFL